MQIHTFSKVPELQPGTWVSGLLAIFYYPPLSWSDFRVPGWRSAVCLRRVEISGFEPESCWSPRAAFPTVETNLSPDNTWTYSDSNREPSPCKGVALPLELQARCSYFSIHQGVRVVDLFLGATKAFL